MTTVAYCRKDNEIAYDSRSTSGSLIVSDHETKHVCKKGVHFFFCGSFKDSAQLVEAYLDKADAVEIDEGGQAFVVDKGEVFRFGTDDGDKTWKESMTCSYAIGSGMMYALTAMDLGCSAKDAVKMAIKRDCHTGGTIHVFKIGKDKK